MSSVIMKGLSTVARFDNLAVGTGGQEEQGVRNCQNGDEEQAKTSTVAINSRKQKHFVSRFPGTGPRAKELCPKACEDTRDTHQKNVWI